MQAVVMMFELRPIPTQLGSEEESPLTMSECESLENICDYEEIYNRRASAEELAVANMDRHRLPKLKNGNKSKPITKIFRDKSFSPSLEDIKEVEDRNSKEDGVNFETPYFFSLARVHYDRALNSGFLEQDVGRSFRNEYWKSLHRRSRRNGRRTISV